MLPASNRGAGQFIAQPDVCLTPVGMVPVPIPYVNVALNAQAAAFAPNVLASGLPMLNMGSIIPMSMGDEPGVLHPTTKGAATVVMGNPIVYVAALPGVNLTCPTTGNNFNAPSGLVAVPSATNVLLTYAGPGARDAEGAPAGVDVSAAEVRTMVRALAATGGEGPVHGELLADGVGYIEVRVFSAAVPPAVFAAVRALRAQGMEVLIIDLRGNPGGELRAMAELAGDFLPPGSLVVSVTDGDGDATWLRAQGPRLYSFPLVVLVDNATASAAELFAGSMKSHGRAVIVGEATRGKASAQALIPAPDGGAHYATAATCALPNGEVVEGSGITPDIERRGLPRPPPPRFFEEVYPGARAGELIASSL